MPKAPIQTVSSAPKFFQFKLRSRLDPLATNLLKQIGSARRGPMGGRMVSVKNVELEIFTREEIAGKTNIVHIRAKDPRVTLPYYARIVNNTAWELFNIEHPRLYIENTPIPSVPLDRIVQRYEEMEQKTMALDSPGAAAVEKPELMAGDILCLKNPHAIVSYNGPNLIAAVDTGQQQVFAMLEPALYRLLPREGRRTVTYLGRQYYLYGIEEITQKRNEIWHTPISSKGSRLGGEHGSIEVGSDVFGITEIGRNRAHNEDSILAARLPDGKMLAVLCDGVGGHASGEVAAKMAAHLVYAYLFRGATFQDAVISANLIVFAETQKRRSNMATTLVALLIDQNQAVLAHMGDSRAYRIRGGEHVLLTRDNSLAVEAFEKDRGRLEFPLSGKRLHQLDEYIRASGIGNYIVSAVGKKDSPRVAGGALDVVFTRPDVRDGDRFLLCSDGLHGVIYEEEFDRVAQEHSSPPDLAVNLVNIANSPNRNKDNISALAVRYRAPEIEKTVFMGSAASQAIRDDDLSMLDGVLKRKIPVTKDEVPQILSLIEEKLGDPKVMQDPQLRNKLETLQTLIEMGRIGR